MSLPRDYTTRIYAGILGKLIGVFLGRPFEGWTFERTVREFGEIDDYLHDHFGGPLVVTDDDIAGLGHSAAGKPKPAAPKGCAQSHFSLPGSVHGFRLSGSEEWSNLVFLAAIGQAAIIDSTLGHKLTHLPPPKIDPSSAVSPSRLPARRAAFSEEGKIERKSDHGFRGLAGEVRCRPLALMAPQLDYQQDTTNRCRWPGSVISINGPKYFDHIVGCGGGGAIARAQSRVGSAGRICSLVGVLTYHDTG